jgi:hypothetical protein
VRSFRTQKPSKLLRISSGDFMICKCPNATLGYQRRLHKPNWPRLKVAGVSKGKLLTEGSDLAARYGSP